MLKETKKLTHGRNEETACRTNKKRRKGVLNETEKREQLKS